MINMQRILGPRPPLARSLAIVALLGTGLLLSGCGQKGPLYLPTAATQDAPTAPTADAAGAREKALK